MKCFPRARRWPWALAAWVGLLGAGPRVVADVSRGALSMSDPMAPALLVTYFDEFLQDRDVEAFRARVAARYTEGTLARLVRNAPAEPRRAAVVALGLMGSFDSNALVARALRDRDPVVRRLARSALWAIWFRADTPENNAELDRVRDLLGRGEADEAIERATRLIGRSPSFAEAYNQRAVAYFGLGRYDDSAADCRRVLERNPYHIGALSGLGQCCLELGRRDEALAAFRRALELLPFDDGLRSTVRVLEASDR